MFARRLLRPLALGGCLAVAPFAAAPLAAQAPDAATIATAARGARLDRAHTRSASIDGKRFDITPADFSACARTPHPRIDMEALG